MTGTYCGALPVLPAQRAPSLLGSRCRLRPLYVPPSTCYGFPAKVCQVASPCRSPDTESLRKRSRCPFSLPTWHGIPAKVFQVSFPAVHLLRNHHKSVPGGISCCPPGTASLPMFWRQFEQNTLCCHHDGRLSCIWKMKATERKPQDESHEMEPAEWKPRNGSHRTEATG